ncbi:MAG TPA: carboxypeptidase regulatory-like domain-containing protein [Acidobacteriota bacterium]|nr:carboxypeptidase regulatory-like domain-containing protein [Acidobacteriota bacterium]
MSSQNFKLTLTIFILIVVATVGHTQTQTGGIVGNVTDPDSNAVPGVTVTITSPALIRGPMTTQSDRDGYYRFTNLPPGTYRMEFSNSGFRSLVREGIEVRVASTISVNATLEVNPVSEALVVTGESPVVDIKQTTVGTNFSKEILEEVPNARDIWSLMEQTPAVVTDKVNVGGIESGLQSLFSARGGSWQQNQFNLDGINVTDPSAIGASLFYFDFDTFEEVQTTTGAASAEVTVPGVFINVVTKSGGNELHGGAKFLYEDEALQAHNLDDDLRQAFNITPDIEDLFQRIDYLSDASVQIGGPIQKDRIWFFGAYRDHRIHRGVPFYPVAEGTDIKYALFKGTFNIANNNTLTGLWAGSWYFKPDRGAVDFGGAFVTPESTWIEDDVSQIYQSTWNSVLSEKALLDARISYARITFPLIIKTDNQARQELTTYQFLDAMYLGFDQLRRRLQINGSLSYYVDNWMGGKHDLKVGFDFQHGYDDTTGTANDDLFYLDFAGQPLLVFLWNTPYSTKDRIKDYAFFAQDSYKLGKATIDAGFRVNLASGKLPAQGAPGGNFSQPREFGEVENIPDWKTIAPRLGFIYDLFGNGKTAIKANYARYFAQLGVGYPDYQNFAGLGGQLFFWSDLNGNGRLDAPGELQGGAISRFGGAFGPNESGVSIVDPDLKRPKTDEFTIGVDTELAHDMLLTTTFIYRKDTDLQEDINVGVPFSAYSPVTIQDPGPDGVLGTGDDGGTFTVFNQDPATLGQDRFVLTNPPGNEADYRGVEIQVNKRFSNKWQMITGLTLGRSNAFAKGSGSFIPGGNADTGGVSSGLFDSPNSLINADGRSFWDRPVIFKLAGSYSGPWDIVFGGFLRAQSGVPFPRQIQITTLNQGPITIFAQKVGDERLPFLTTLDLSFTKNFSIQNGTLGLSFDLFNVFNENTVIDAQTLSGPAYLVPKTILSPRVARVGVRFDF